MASGTIHCTVVRAGETNSRVSESQHDLLPWADPYIASLFRDLERHEQQERERSQFRRNCIEQVFAAEPTPVALDAELPEDRWSLHAA